MLSELKERARSATRPLSVVDLGVIGYAECWEMQNRLAAQVASGEAPDTLLLLEHPHTYTCGRKGGHDHILASQDELEREGIALLDVDRGGDVTYHGPGQLVSYPIINLLREASTVDYHAYLRSLEQALIGASADFAINAYRLPAYSGVWVGEAGCEEKIAAIGVRVDGRGITTHGVALNITTDLSYFGKIVPCGISNKGVSSMAKLLPHVPTMAEVKASFASHFGTVFGFFV